MGTMIWRASHSAVGLRVTANQSSRRVRAEIQKCEQLLERNCRNHKQIDRCNPFHMIADEGLPGLQWPILPRHHVDRNRGLGDVDVELEQLTIDLWGAPERVLQAHSLDQVAHLFGDPRSPPRRTRLPSPVPAPSTIDAAGCTIAHACNINNRKSLFLNRLLSTGSELPVGESMGVERQNGVDLQFESVQVIDQVHLAADGKG
jgi:hypothetical protein